MKLDRKENVKILLWNATSVKTKNLEIQKFLTDQNIDIAIITETWLAPTDTFRLHNYNITRKDRATADGKARGGGVLIATHSSIQTDNIPQPHTTTMETATIRLKIARDIIIGAAYAPPTNKITSSDLDEITVKSPTKYYLIGGDFNAKHQLWNNITRNSNGTTIKNHAEAESYLIIHSPTYTHKQPNSNPSNIDIFLSNIPYPYKITTLDELSSNHLPVMLTIQLTSGIRSNRGVQTTNWGLYKTICNTYQICTALDTPDKIDAQIERVQQHILSAHRRATHTHNTTRNQQYIDPYLQNLITNRNKYRRKHQRTGNPTYKLLRNIFTTQIQKRLKHLRNTEWQNKLNRISTTDHTLWQTYRITGGPKAHIPALQDAQTGQTFFGDKDKAEAIATKFAATHDKAYHTGSTHARQVRDSVENLRTQRFTNDNQISTSPRELYQIIRSLPNGKAPGADKITAQQLKNLPRKTLVQLYYIFKSCLQLTYFPKVWKIAKIHPVPGRDKTDLSSYRPISLLSTLSKVLERIIYTRLLKHLNINAVIIPQQFGFREKHSCTQQLLRVMEHATIEINKNRITQLILLDIEKAFDSVWHDALIYKLRTIDTPPQLTLMIQDYLSNRRMFVSINGEKSSIKTIRAGVPQGSIIGPTLYNLYTNDIPTSQNTHLAIYADDTAIYSSSWNPRQATQYIQSYLDHVLDYFQKWKLTVNPQKTQAITFSRKKTEITECIRIQGQQIPWVDKVKYLGITLDKKISWAPAIKARVNLAYPALKRLYPLIAPNSKLKTEIKITLYKVCIRPIITYGHQIWAAAPKTHIAKVQRMQNRFLRIILNAPRDTRITTLHRKAKIPTIPEYIKESITRTYDNTHPNPLISRTGDYNVQSIPIKIRVRLPKHVLEDL